MGVDKALLLINGVSLLQHQCATLQGAGISELILSTGQGSPVVIPGAKIVLDAYGDVGPIAGIAAVLEAASCPVAFVLAGDMPLMTPEMIRHILSLSNEDRGCVPRVHGRHEPLAAAYPRSLLPPVRNQISAGRHALQDLIEEAIVAGQMTSLEIGNWEIGNGEIGNGEIGDGEIGDGEAGCFMNCNHPGEWQSFLDSQETGRSGR